MQKWLFMLLCLVLSLPTWAQEGSSQEYFDVPKGKVVVLNMGGEKTSATRNKDGKLVVVFQTKKKKKLKNKKEKKGKKTIYSIKNGKLSSQSFKTEDIEVRTPNGIIYLDNSLMFNPKEQLLIRDKENKEEKRGDDNGGGGGSDGDDGNNNNNGGNDPTEPVGDFQGTISVDSEGLRIEGNGGGGICITPTGNVISFHNSRLGVGIQIQSKNPFIFSDLLEGTEENSSSRTSITTTGSTDTQITDVDTQAGGSTEGS